MKNLIPHPQVVDFTGVNPKFNKRLTCKPGSVPAAVSGIRPLSFIWPHHHWYSHAAYPSRHPSVFRRQKTKRAVLPCDRDIFGLATHETYGSPGHPGNRCALTAPFHPYPGGEPPGRSFSVTWLQAFTRLPVRKHGTLRCPDFPYRLTPARQSGQPPQRYKDNSGFMSAEQNQSDRIPPTLSEKSLPGGKCAHRNSEHPGNISLYGG